MSAAQSHLQSAATDAADATKFAGPWHVVQAHDGCWRVREGATVWMWRATREEARAAADEENRRWRLRQVELAAPEFHAAALAFVDRYRNISAELLAEIARDRPGDTTIVNGSMAITSHVAASVIAFRAAIAKAEPSR